GLAGRGVRAVRAPVLIHPPTPRRGVGGGEKTRGAGGRRGRANARPAPSYCWTAWATAAWGRIGRRPMGRPVAARTAEATAAGEVTAGTALAGLAPKGATTSRSSAGL